MKKFSRRTVVKVGASLFAFLPIAKSLSSTTDASAYVPCEQVNCYLTDSFCYIPPGQCDGIVTGYFSCYDIHDNSYCYVEGRTIGTCRRNPC